MDKLFQSLFFLMFLFSCQTLTAQSQVSEYVPHLLGMRVTSDSHLSQVSTWNHGLPSAEADTYCSFGNCQTSIYDTTSTVRHYDVTGFLNTDGWSILVSCIDARKCKPLVEGKLYVITKVKDLEPFQWNFAGSSGEIAIPSQIEVTEASASTKKQKSTRFYVDTIEGGKQVLIGTKLDTFYFMPTLTATLKRFHLSE